MIFHSLIVFPAGFRSAGFLLKRCTIGSISLLYAHQNSKTTPMSGLKEIERRIYVSYEIALHEYQYVYGNKKDNKVWFKYYNTKKDEVGKTIEYENYNKALNLARTRACDGRYKNYEYWIEV